MCKPKDVFTRLWKLNIYNINYVICLQLIICKVIIEIYILQNIAQTYFITD